jgi:hypothetical protein
LSNTAPLAWKRLLTEGAVIVGSILLAFAIDAWWDEHKRDKDVLEVLRLVELETIANLANLKTSIAHHEDIVSAIGAAHDKQSIESNAGAAVIDVEVFEPISDALKTLVSTGMLSAIGDVDLRIALSAFDSMAKDLAEKELAALRFREAARRRIASLGQPIYATGGIPKSSPVYTDIEILNLLAMRATEEYQSIESGRRLETHLQNILVQLDALIER